MVPAAGGWKLDGIRGGSAAKSRKVEPHDFAYVANDFGAEEPQKSRKVKRHDFAYVANDFVAEKPQVAQG